MTEEELRQQKHLAEEKNLRALIARNYSACVMNNTKWNELAEALYDLGLVFTIQFVDMEEPVGGGGFWSPHPRYWDGPFGPFLTLAIEWLEIDPIRYEQQGHLLSPQRIDCGAAVEARLQQIHVPYHREGERFRITGYIRHANLPADT